MDPNVSATIESECNRIQKEFTRSMSLIEESIDKLNISYFEKDAYLALARYQIFDSLKYYSSKFSDGKFQEWLNGSEMKNEETTRESFYVK
jgi:hypothetical protein